MRAPAAAGRPARRRPGGRRTARGSGLSGRPPPGGPWPERGFRWQDGDRLLRFGPGAIAEAPELVRAWADGPFILVSTPRAREAAAGLAAAAASVVDVPAGAVPDAAAAIRRGLTAGALVALGGGRVIDAAKAVAAVDGRRCAAVPTTLSGAEMTGGHRLPAGVTGDRRVRPSLVVNDPDVSASQPGPALAASAMNALGHAFEALYAPRANPLAELAALRAAALIAAGVGAGDPDRPAVGLGALLAGWAMDTTGFAVHHVLCQSVVRRSGASHAGVNAVLLPHVVRLMAPRAPREVALFAEALGAGSEPGAEVARLAGRAGATRLEELGVDGAALDGALADALRRPELADTPDAPGEDELRSLLEAAR